jgi:hypothetical protein
MGGIKAEDSVQDRSVRKCEFLPRGNGPVASWALEHAKLKTAHYVVVGFYYRSFLPHGNGTDLKLTVDVPHFGGYGVAPTAAPQLLLGGSILSSDV